MSFVLGLTGGIGSGKTAAADMLAALGAAVVDTDAIAHELTAPGGEAIGPLRAGFGAAVIDAEGALDRAAMRKLAFSDATAKVRLETIMHPMIRAVSERRCAQAAAAGAAYVVLVVPLLVESKTYKNRVGRVLVIDCPEAIQVSRVMARSGLGRAEVERIMAAQATRAQRLAAADDVILNDGDRDKLRRQVEALHQRYLALAAEGQAKL